MQKSAFLTVSSLSLTDTKEILLLFLERICHVFLRMTPLAIATVRLEFWYLTALLVGVYSHFVHIPDLQIEQYK